MNSKIIKRLKTTLFSLKTFLLKLKLFLQRAGGALKYFSFRKPVQSTKLILKVMTGHIGLKSLILHLFGEDILKETLEICKKLDIKPFLIFGTLLGYQRDNKFIEHDFDIDLGLFENDFSKMNIFEKLMIKKGYVIRRSSKYEISFIKPKYPSLYIDFFLFYKSNGKMLYSVESGEHVYTFSFSANIFKIMKEVIFLNKTWVLVPSEIEKFLTECYGNWRIIKKGFNFINDHPNLVK